MTEKRKACVKTAKKIVYKRDGQKCARCAKRLLLKQCNASHVVSEARSKVLSCDTMNIKVLCYTCHRWRHENPKEALERFQRRFKERREYLKEKMREMVYPTIPYFENRLEELREEEKLYTKHI